jgi:hypothetical protein
MTFIAEKPIGVFYEHPLEYNPLLATLKTRNIQISPINPSQHDFSLKTDAPKYSLIYNDLTAPLGFSRSSKTISHLLAFTKNIELNNHRWAQSSVINGSVAIETLSDRARQLSVFASLDLATPRTRIVNNLERLISILPEFNFPLLVKSNNASSNLPVLRFDSLSELIDSVVSKTFLLQDDLLLIQEYHQPKDNHIVRVDTLNGKFLSAQKIYTIREPLQLWPVEYKTDVFTPSVEIVQAVELIARTARIDIGSVEYFTDQKTNQILFYSIRPHTNSRSSKNGALQIDAIADYFEKRISKAREIQLAL